METRKKERKNLIQKAPSDGRDLLDELNIAIKENKEQIKEKKKRENELRIANIELCYQQAEKAKRAAELDIANIELNYQQAEKANRASELSVANKELAYQTKEKQNRADELDIANIELNYQQAEKANRASELSVANKELAYQTKEKQNRADELDIANIELNYQQAEKANRASELSVANKELAYQTKEKQNRADELDIANIELNYQQAEKANRASELSVANKELEYQTKEKQNRADELGLANIELSYQQAEKADRASELIIVKQTMMEQEIEIENLNYRNDLPGLFNRKYFIEALKKYDKETNLPISIIMGDLNGLAIIDDSLGHSVVDDIQAKLNTILKKVAREADVIICFSNGEFGLILPETTLAQSNVIIEELKVLTESEKAGPLNISISCGAHTKTSMDMDLNDIVKEAHDKLSKDRKIVSHEFERHTIDLIMEMLFEKNNREMLHSSRVGMICEKIASKLSFDPGVVDRIRITGMLHDIGKIAIDERILNKGEGLDKNEWEAIKKHAEIGHRILSASNDFSKYAEDVLEHHEHVDGSGYPRGLVGSEISIVAKIIAIADTYDAITSDRPYRKAVSRKEAIAEIQRNAGIQFDAEIVKVFAEMMHENDRSSAMDNL